MLRPFPKQQEAIDKMVELVKKNSFALNTSGLGSGKTLQAIETCKALGKAPVVVAPASTLTAWERALDEQEVDYYTVLSWDKARTGKTKWYTRNKRARYGRWRIPRNGILIFDEVHKAKAGSKTLQGRMAVDAASQGVPTIALSGTPFENPLHCEYLAIATKEIQDSYSFKSWCRKRGCYQNFFNGWEFNPFKPAGEAGLAYLRNLLYGEKGCAVQITRKDLAEFFTTSTLHEILVDFDSKTLKEMKKLEKYVLRMDKQREEDLERDIQKFNEATEKGQEPVLSTHLREILRARQEIEVLKTPILAEKIEELLGEKKSVVVFVNFRETTDALLAQFPDVPSVVIDGTKTGHKRQEEIDKFQRDEAYLAIVQFQAGGAGISLHDVRGSRPRASILNTTFSITDTLQALGRIDRAGAKSDTEQFILVAAGTYEEEVFKAVKEKHYTMQKAVL